MTGNRCPAWSVGATRPVQDRAGGADRSGVRRLGPHAAAYLLILVALATVVPLDASFGSDDGAYGGAVNARRNGSWFLERPVPVVAQANEGWHNSAITPRGPAPYTAKPSWVVALDTTVRVVHGPPVAGQRAGDLALGLHLLPLAGALVSALAAWLVAARFDPGAAPLAFWLVALGPCLVNATTLWAHTPSAALAGLALFGFVTLLPPTGPGPATARDGPTTVTTVATVAGISAALAGAAVIRNESLFWIVALCVSMVVLTRGRMVILVTTTVAAGASTAAWLADRSWGAGLRADRLPIETSIDALGPDPGWLASRVPAGWQLLVTSLGGGPGPVLTVVACALALVGAIRIRFAPGESARSVPLIGASAALYATLVVVAPGEVISGTVAAWPLVAVLLIAGRDQVRSLAPLLLPSGLLVLTVAATQYGSSGGHQWGGRYLSMAYVPLGAAAAVAGHRLVRRHPVPFGALLVVPAVLGAVATRQLHVRHHQVVATTTGQPAEVVVTGLTALPRIAWTELPTAFYVADEATVTGLLGELGAAGVVTVNVQGIDDLALDGVAGYEVVGESGGVRHLRRTSAVAFGDDPAPPAGDRSGSGDGADESDAPGIRPSP